MVALAASSSPNQHCRLDVTPVPDPRLAKKAVNTLSAAVDATADWLPLAQPPAGLPVSYGALKPAAGTDCKPPRSLWYLSCILPALVPEISLRTGLIGSEIVTYAAVNASSPVGLSGVTRGAYGTKAAAHPAGATVYLMTQVYGGFLPDPSTDMLAEVGANIARAYNSAGMDMIYVTL